MFASPNNSYLCSRQILKITKMKKLFILVAMLIVGIAAHSQNVSGKCYRGYIDAGYSFGAGGKARNLAIDRLEFNTSHGYQVNPYIFIGAGFGVHLMSSYETLVTERDRCVDVPVFANLRFNFTKTRVAPFFDAKAGLYVTNNGELYLNPSLGVRLAVNKKQAINFSIGYTYANLEYRKIGSRYIDYKKYPTDAVTVRLGFEF